MTRSPADVGLSPDAAARLEDYLVQVRAALVRAPDVNPDEIEADIREHVGHELLAAPRPVPLAAVEAVLTRLGPPSQWGTGDDPTLLFRARHVLRGARATMAEQLRGARAVLWRGPEDWRLTYLSFGAFALGVLSFGFLMPICLPLSYLLSRAGLTHAREKGLALGGRKWLLYPPVVIVSLALMASVALWPVCFGGVAAEEVDKTTHRVARDEGRDHLANGQRVVVRGLDFNVKRNPDRMASDRKVLAALPADPDFAPAAAGLFVGAGAILMWWVVLGLLVARFPGAVRAAFCPLCDGLEPRHGKSLALGCAVLLIPWCAAAYEVVVALG
jgi:hypothetical protein